MCVRVSLTPSVPVCPFPSVRPSICPSLLLFHFVVTSLFVLSLHSLFPSLALSLSLSALDDNECVCVAAAPAFPFGISPAARSSQALAVPVALKLILPGVAIGDRPSSPAGGWAAETW